MITAFIGNKTFLNLGLNNDEWKWNGYGTLFHPPAEGFWGPKGVFAELGSSQHRLLGACGACWSGRWNSRFVCSSLCLFYRGQIALFVCSSFWWLEIMMEKWMIGFGGIFLDSHPFISAMSCGCAGDASRILLYQTVCLPCKDLIIVIFLTFMIC